MSDRAVYDTMVLFQWAVLPPGRLHGTARAAIEGAVELCLSPELLAEARDLLTRPAIQAKSKSLTPDRVAQFLEELANHANVFADVPKVFTWAQHPDDDHLFNLAIHAEARYLVTWETRILRLGERSTPAANELARRARGMRILTPVQLARQLKLIS